MAGLYEWAAAIWGFAFIAFFRFELETFYPYYRSYLPLSQFALVLVAIGFVALASRRQSESKRSTFMHLGATILISAGVLAVCYLFGQEQAHLFFILPLTLAALFIWFEISRQALLFQSAKLFWLIGAIFGLATARFLPSVYAVYGVATFAVILASLITAPKIQIVHERLLALRLPIDLVRYAFLAEAFHTALGHNRAYLLLILLITITGLITPQILARIHPIRPHIGQGLLFLPMIFTGLAILFNLIHYSIWGAIGYAALAIWESIYFKKAHEVYLGREKLLAGGVLVGAIIAYNIAIEWLQIISGLFVVAVLGYTLYLVARAKRKIIVALFSTALIVWVISLQWKYTSSITREFWRPLRSQVHRPTLPDSGLVLTLLSLQKTSDRGIYSNIFPDELLQDAAWTGQNIFARKSDPAILTAQLWYACSLNLKKRIYVFDEKSLGLYSEPAALVTLGSLLEKIKDCDLYLTDGSSMRSVRKLGEEIRGAKPTPQNIKAEDAAKFLSLARSEQRRENLTASAELYDLIFSHYAKEPAILREMSALAAARGQLDRQINLLTSVISLAKDSVIYDKKLLMELYGLKRDKKKSAALAYDILNGQSESPLAIFTYIQRLFSEPFDRYEIEALYRRVSLYQPKTELEEIKFKGLKRQLEDQLKQDVTYEQKSRDENHRQEFIYFPE